MMQTTRRFEELNFEITIKLFFHVFIFCCVPVTSVLVVMYKLGLLKLNSN